MSVRTGFSGSIYASTAYAQADTYYATTPFKMFYGADSVRLTLSNTVANAGTVTIKAEISNGASTPVYSQYGPEMTVAMVDTDVKSILLPYRFCGGDTVRVSFKATSVAGGPKLAIDCLAYLDGNDYLLGETAETVTSASDGTLALTVSSRRKQLVTGSGSNYVISLPNATTMRSGDKFEITNASSEFVVVKNSGTASSVFELLGPGCTLTATCSGVSTEAGTWTVEIVWPPTKNISVTDDDFLNGAAFLIANNGTGASSGGLNGAKLDSIGNVYLTTGATAAPIGACYFKNSVPTANGPVQYSFRVYANNVAATGAADYYADFGLGDSFDNTAYTGSIVIRQPANASGLTTWHLYTYASGTPTAVNSGIAVDVSVYTNLRFVVNTARNRVDFWINKTYGGKSTANIPTGALFPLMKNIRTSGGTNTVYIDRWMTAYASTTER